MSAELIATNVVLVARQFNPSVFSQLWLVRNGIVGEEDFGTGCIFSEEVAKIASRQFDLLVLPPQLQFIPKVVADEQGVLVKTVLGEKIVQALQATPYVAVGLNFTWHICPEGQDIGVYSRSLFCMPEKSPFREFDSADARFGTYLSKNVIDCRMKLDVKPITLPTGEVLQFAFNFHADVPS